MEKQDIILLYNSISGKGKGKKMAAVIGQKLLQSDISFASFENEWPNDLHPYKEVWLIGGDGTLNYFLNYYEVIPIPIAVFPGGTGNDFSWKLYGKVPYEKILEKVLQAKVRTVDIGICNGERFINTIGLGFDGEVLKSINAVRFIGGHLGYLLIVLQKIFTFKEIKYKYVIENLSTEKESLLFSISNSSRTGGGFLVSPLAEIDDGKLNIITTGRLNKIQRLLLLSKVEKGKHIHSTHVSHCTAEEINIKAEQDVHYQLDGELRKGNDFVIKVLPKWLLVK